MRSGKCRVALNHAASLQSAFARTGEESVVVDIHTHFVPEVFPEMGGHPGGDRWPQMQRVDVHSGQVMIAGRNFRTVTDDCWSPEQRLAVMAEDRISRQAVSPMPELLSYWAEPLAARAFGRAINEGIAR